jgi:two-component system cell cycle response regulator DivK
LARDNPNPEKKFRLGARKSTVIDMAGKRILAIEDHEENRRLLRDLLTSFGYELLEAVTGEEGVAAADIERPDLILMDIQLPGIDGYETTRRIKANPALKYIPIIAVTSYALSGDDAKAFAAGCDAYVTKPFDPADLLEKIKGYLG